MVAKGTLDDLAAVAKRLNAASDRLNGTIDDFEEYLESIGIGVSVWLDPHGAIDGNVLGYKRIGERWRVAVCPVDDHGILSPQLAMPLASTPRQVRMGAIEQFEQLALALRDKAVLVLADIERAAKK